MFFFHFLPHQIHQCFDILRGGPVEIADKSGIGTGLFSGMLKIIGIGYLTEFSANLCDDYGYLSIGKKIQLGGKITIFLMAIPIIGSLVEIIGNLLV